MKVFQWHKDAKLLLKCNRKFAKSIFIEVALSHGVTWAPRQSLININ